MFGGCDFGDVRLTARAVKMAAAMVENPNGSLPQQMASGAALRGAYRLLNNNRVTFDSVIKSHVGDTVGKIREHTGNVLLIQDSSYMETMPNRGVSQSTDSLTHSVSCVN